MIRPAGLTVLLLVALVVTANAQTDKSDKAKVYKTPQEVFDAFTEADEKGDHKTAVACMAPDAQKEYAVAFAVAMVGVRDMFKASKDKDIEAVAKVYKPVFDALDKHGLTEAAAKEVKASKDAKEQKKAREVVLSLVKDRAAFLVDLGTALDKVDAKKKEEKEKAKLTNLKTEGNMATGTVTFTSVGKDKKETVRKEQVSFVKVSGSWRIYPTSGSSDEEAKDKKE